MTLGERLLETIEKLGMSRTAFIKLNSIGSITFKRIIESDEYTQRTAKKIADICGSEFDEYVTASICKGCGKEYYAFKIHQEYCCSNCSDLGRAKRMRGHKVSPNLIRPTQYKKRKGSKKTAPKESIVEYNNKARKEWLSYGELQARERLNMERMIG